MILLVPFMCRALNQKKSRLHTPLPLPQLVQRGKQTEFHSNDGHFLPVELHENAWGGTEH